MRRSTLAALVGLIAVLGLAWYLQYNPLQTEAAETPVPTALPALWGLNTEQIVRLQFLRASGEQVVLKQSEGEWQVLEPQSGPADAQLVGYAISALGYVEPLALLENPPALETIGLQPPAHTLILELSDGQQFHLEIGNSTVTGSGYYVRLNGGVPTVVSQHYFSTLMGWLDRPPLSPTPTPAAENAIPTP